MDKPTKIPPAGTVVDSAEVEEAFQAMTALQRAARNQPALLGNRYFSALQDTAYARFLMTFEAMQ